MATEFLNKKISKIGALQKEMESLLDKIKNIFVKDENIHITKINIGLQHLNNLLEKLSSNSHPDNTLNRVMLYNDNITINIILNIINDSFVKILDKKVNVETFLSQTFINETREYSQKIQILFSKVKKTIHELDEEILTILGKEIASEISNENTLENFTKFTDMIKTAPYSTLLYTYTSNLVLEHTTKQDVQLSYSIMSIIEQVKDSILNIDNSETDLTYMPINPFFKNFGLVNTSGLLSLETISNLVFDAKSSTISGLSKLCKEKEYDLILIKKILNRGIEYNVLHLMDHNESKKFDNMYSADDGISEDIIKRYRTIDYIADSSAKWDIQYEYLHENNSNKFVLVLQELYQDKYCILSNKLEASKEFRTYFIRKNNVKEFIHFVKNKTYARTRVNNYNDVLNSKITDGMFLYIKPDIETLKVKAQVADPKYLRNEIYVLILNKFKKMFDKKNIKNVYEYSVLIHDEIFVKIFSQVIMNEYYKYLFKNSSIYETENISMSEVYASFLFVLNIYERDFVKKMHDIFLTKIPDSSIFSDKKKNELLYKLFEDLLDEVLHSIITNENNIFQTILYKLYLYKLSIMD